MAWSRGHCHYIVLVTVVVVAVAGCAGARKSGTYVPDAYSQQIDKLIVERGKAYGQARSVKIDSTLGATGYRKCKERYGAARDAVNTFVTRMEYDLKRQAVPDTTVYQSMAADASQALELFVKAAGEYTTRRGSAVDVINASAALVATIRSVIASSGSSNNMNYQLMAEMANSARWKYFWEL